jgi:hypothetical protein
MDVLSTVGEAVTNVSPPTKRCTRCGETKGLGEFCKRVRSLDGLYCWCRMCASLYNKANREGQYQKHKKYVEKNKQRIDAWNKRYWEEHRVEKKAYNAEYRSKNRDTLLAHQRAAKTWRAPHRRAAQRKYEAEQMESNPQFHLKHCLRSRIRVALRGIRKSASTPTLVGCSVEYLKKYLESQFKPGWSWENYGSAWTIDHRRPCDAFNLLDPNEQRACFHYTNLRPLDRIENIVKGTKILDTEGVVL